MGQRLFTLGFLLAALGFCPTRADALDRVAGDGFGYVVPGGFQAAPRKMREASEKRCVEIASQIPTALKGRPTFRMFIVPAATNYPEASISSYTFTLAPGQNQPSVGLIKLDAFETSLLQGMSSLPDLRTSRTVHRNLGEVVALVSTLAYDHASAGNRILRVALITRNHVACLMILDSPAEREGAYRVHWDGIIGSLRLGTASDQEGFLLRYMPIFGVTLGILAVLGFAFVGHMRRRQRDRMRSVDESGFRGNTISDLKGSRAVDGLEIFDQEEPPPRENLQPSPPPQAPPLARSPRAPSKEIAPKPDKDEDALDFDIPMRKFDKRNDVIAGAGVATAEAPDGPGAPAQRQRKILPASPKKKTDGGPPKIVRNTDYMRED